VTTLTGNLGGPLAKRAAGALSLVASVGIMAAALVPGMITGAAAGIPDVGNAGVFELDGNVAQNSATPPPYDWTCVFNNPAGHTGCPPSSNPSNTATTPTFLGSVFQADYVTPDTTYFSSNGAGVKDINDIPQWGCTTINNPTIKDDILNAYGAVFLAHGNSPKAGHELLYLAEERASANGDSFAGFWLMHHQHACVNGAFSNGGHDPGDLLVVSNYTNGGTNPTIQLFAWDTSVSGNLKLLASGFTCGASNPPPGLVHPDDICGKASDAAFTEPWPPNQLLQPNQFVEVGIDLTDLVQQGIFPPSTSPSGGCFNDFLAETRSSQQTTATLKDFTTGQFVFCVAPKVTTMQTAGQTTSALMTVARGTPVTDQAVLGAPISGTPLGSVTYKLYSTPDCTGPAVFTSTKQVVAGIVPPSDPVSTSNLSLGVTYQWQAVYSGDISLGGHNFASQSACGDEPLTLLDANITITPLYKANEVSNQHVFSIVASVLPASAALTNATISTSVSPPPSGSTSTCGSPVIAGNQATCTLTINSTGVQRFTADATATLTVGSVSMTRSTALNQNHGPGGSGSATKDYVNAFITITPATAVNAVGTPHTFHITFTALYPPNTSPAVGPWTITPSVISPPSTALSQNTTTCTSPTIVVNNAAGKTTATCDLTINTPNYGIYTANVAGVVTVNNVVLSRTTAPNGALAGPGGSGPAVKHYVDASVAIGPNGINPVGQQHVFTVTVTAYPAGLTSVTFPSITTSVQPLPNVKTDTCGSPVITGPDPSTGTFTATCTLTVDNSLANIFTANATAQVSMGGVTVIRTTAPNGSLAGPGGSGPATKTYVDAAVAIAPTAVNEVGHPHVFNVTVTAIPSGATPVVFNSINPTIFPTPGSTVSTCGTPVLSGPALVNTVTEYFATCTVTINNNAAGTFTANVAAQVTMGGTSVTRTTAGNGSLAGPGGSGPATKTYVDANIQISPLSATNSIGDPHTFAVTVNAIPSGALPVDFGPVTIVVTSPTNTPLIQNVHSCSFPLGNMQLCSVTINSNLPGTFIINATAQVTMGGVTVIRTTAPNGTLAGPGGTGPATKIYAMPHITIAPSAVNEVGHQHTFTITVTSVANTETIFTKITPLVTPTPSSYTSTCANPNVNFNTGVATCTVTINSTSAGVFTATATADLLVNGFPISVSTDGVSPNSGVATKTYVDANVAITPRSADNEVGNLHVFTITVKGFPAGKGFAVTSITPSVTSPTNTPLTQNISTCGSPTINVPAATATCTVTINSVTAGTFIVNAAAVVTVDGLQLTRSTATNAGPNGTGPATKHYVNASVGIGPTAFNPVGQQHVFNIVVTAYPGGASPVSFTSITPSVSPSLVLPSVTTCGSPNVVGNQATCTLTINSNLPNNFTANVTAVVTMGTVAVTRSTATNPGPGGTGPATKTYVTANIGLTPLVADDPVGDLHTLTARVTTNNGSGIGQPQVAPNGTVVSFTLVSGPGTLASPSCTITNGLGTCTDVLTSSVAGTSVVQAATTVVVDEVTLHRTTNDSVPGDSVNAVKNWHKVQPSIVTVQSAGGTIGTTLSDTATVSGGLNPTGTVTFQLFNNVTCSSTPVFISSNQPLSNGKASSGNFKPTTTATFEWVATYNGDNANLTAVSGCGAEPVTIVAAGVLGITSPIKIPNTGAGMMTALAEGLGLVLAGTGIVVLARRRRRNGGD
jgi:LPXTG-motif cell wall-anchored protein